MDTPTSPPSPSTGIPDSLRDFSLGWSPWAAIAAAVIYFFAAGWLGFTLVRVGKGITLAGRWVLFCTARIAAYAIRAFLPSQFRPALYIAYWSVFVSGNGLFISAWNRSVFAWTDRTMAGGIGLATTRAEASSWRKRFLVFRIVIDLLTLIGVALGVVGVVSRFRGGPNIQGHGIVMFICIGLGCIAGVIGFARVGGLSSPEKLLGWSKELMNRDLELQEIREAAARQRWEHEHETGSTSGMSGSTAQASSRTQSTWRAREDAYLFLDAAKRLRKIVLFRLLPCGAFFAARLFYQPYTVPADRVTDPAYAEPPYYALVVGFELIALAFISVPWDAFAFLELPSLAEKLDGRRPSASANTRENDPDLHVSDSRPAMFGTPSSPARGVNPVQVQASPTR
ncbi:hypothetical protein M427DRAFT_38271 [Gonapodya prolifera JEL478]|uniref:Uncharacterized protein n=1 Tax=Gonapodya prolifera (strain JEL478) TaxID=1344416 RepID=A0A138ZZA9_GONPJ|nr:hypothetical protein M427DRAFT_38271 [Gonapodya prolifera JEL478]|eukprot:KXS09846.1 hypothetical protein M427DRAFT_38271 [Gonapodya prolifera JEL478]